ncbi:hypothetical protein C8R46DRAFT_1030587 [Mycena filopes]|nr:hypothetical protein C8R46DRAFT_1030587 [Mycena filopes]
MASHKRKAARPMLVVASTASHVTSNSADHRRVRTQIGLVGQDAGPSKAPQRYWEEDLATNRARLDPCFTYSLGDDSLSAQPDDIDVPDDGINIVLPAKTRNTTSDRPLQTWQPYEDEYLNEQLRHEGRGAHKAYAQCAGDARRCKRPAEWRCADQACVGEVMHCAECIVIAHAQLPTHFIEVSYESTGASTNLTHGTQKWTGTGFERKRTWLRDLGLRIQLGHPPGVVCPYRQAAPHDFVLYDVSGVHEIGVDFCGCRPTVHEKPLEHRVQLMRMCWWPATVVAPNTCATFGVLRLFQTLNCLGKLSAYDFLRGLELCTNHDGLDKPPDRRKPFMHIMRQFREVKRMKHSKRGHKPGGAQGTSLGEATLMCRACPQPGRNLPENWQEIEAMFRFIYFLFLAQDANFRLSNRNVSSESVDPIIGDGWGYFCKREGEDGYKAHIAKHVNDVEISNCSGAADDWNRGGYMLSAQHVAREWDWGLAGRRAVLQHGFLASIGAVDVQPPLRRRLLRYERMSKLPEPMRLKLAPSNVWWKVPNFHLPPHKKPCHSPYSFHWMWGAGMTHGEGVEQNWAFSNGAAASTRLMGPGSRQATLEDVFGFHNYDRILAMHRVLPKRLAVSIKEGAKHRAAFDTFNDGLEAVRPAEVAEWREWVIRWESKQHTDASESPFELTDEVTTLRQIQLEIASEELICTDDGVEVEQEHTPGVFISMGLEIEEQQRRLEVDVKALKDPSPTQRLAFTKRRTTLLKRIFKFRQIQRVYMPSVRAILSDRQRQVFDGNGEQLPEATRLFSAVRDQERGHAGKVMRGGASGDGGAYAGGGGGGGTGGSAPGPANSHHDEPGMMTKGQGILRQINIKIHIAKLRYRYSRAALMALRGHEVWEDKLGVLNDNDIRALNERALTAEEKAQNEHWAELGGAVIEGGVARAAGLASGEGSHTLSWIWYSAHSKTPTNEELHAALRVEWCKAYARAKRYSEDVRLLREEMRLTIAFGQSEAAMWDALAAQEVTGVDDELAEGRRAYAAEHADTERRTCAMLEAKWAGILSRADQFLEGQTVFDADIVTVELDMGDELDADEEEALLEGDD